MLVIVVINMFEKRSFAKMDVPLGLSKTTCNTSTASYWELKSNRLFMIPDILRLKTHIKFDGSMFRSPFLDGHISSDNLWNGWHKM